MQTYARIGVIISSSQLGSWHSSVMRTPVALPPNTREREMRDILNLTAFITLSVLSVALLTLALFGF